MERCLRNRHFPKIKCPCASFLTSSPYIPQSPSLHFYFPQTLSKLDPQTFFTSRCHLGPSSYLNSFWEASVAVCYFPQSVLYKMPEGRLKPRALAYTCISSGSYHPELVLQIPIHPTYTYKPVFVSFNRHR
jgi:hypothetical protein